MGKLQKIDHRVLGQRQTQSQCAFGRNKVLGEVESPECQTVVAQGLTECAAGPKKWRSESHRCRSRRCVRLRPLQAEEHACAMSRARVSQLRCSPKGRDSDVLALPEHVVRKVQLDEAAVMRDELGDHNSVERAEPLAAVVE